MDYKILSYLLFYPNEEFLANISLLKNNSYKEIKDSLLLKNISSFIDNILSKDKYEAMSKYVAYFDNNPSLSLYFFDHIMGDSKERGQALIDLKELYAENNFVVDSNQLPDFLPLFLEFLSVIDENKAKNLLLETYDVINILYLRHKKINSYYSFIFKSIIQKMEKEVTPMEVKVLSAKEIDEMWQEQEVTFLNKS